MQFLAAKDSRVFKNPGIWIPFINLINQSPCQNSSPNSEVYSLPPSGNPPGAESTDPREPVRVMLIGTATGMELVIAHLHSIGFAEPRAWSKPQIDPTTGQPMRILTKWIRR